MFLLSDGNSNVARATMNVTGKGRFLYYYCLIEKVIKVVIGDENSDAIRATMNDTGEGRFLSLFNR